MHWRVLLILYVLLGTSSEVAAQTAPPFADSALSPGDAIRISVWRKPELSGEFVVASDSSIAHPLYADLRVAGVPMASVRDRVRRFVEQYEVSPRVLVEPLFRIAVGGEVRQPNLYSLRPETTIAQAVALAGGPTERGNLSQVRILREGRLLIVDLTEPRSGMPTMAIRSGDQIIILRNQDLLRDYIAPVGSIAAAFIGLIGILLK